MALFSAAFRLNTYTAVSGHAVRDEQYHIYLSSSYLMLSPSADWFRLSARRLLASARCPVRYPPRESHRRLAGMVSGMTVAANLVGIPFGTYLSEI